MPLTSELFGRAPDVNNRPVCLAVGPPAAKRQSHLGSRSHFPSTLTAVGVCVLGLMVCSMLFPLALLSYRATFEMLRCPT